MDKYYETLVIDDDKVVCFLINKVLENVSFQNVSTFYKAKEALSYMLKNNDEEHNFLVLLDINMPVMSAWGFLDLLKEYDFQCTINVAILSSSVDSRDKQKADTYDEVFSYLIKPLEKEMILDFQSYEGLKPFFK